MSDQKKTLSTFTEDLFSNKKKLLTYAGLTVGAISLFAIGRHYFQKNARSKLQKLNQLRQIIFEERLKSKEIVELEQTITEARNKSTAIVELHTDEEIVIPAKKGDALVSFVFSYMENLNKKYSGGPKPANPFLPPFETGLFITDLSPDYRLLFNKFAVVKRHVLIVTSAFEEQISPLNRKDFAQGYKVLLAVNGFCFYNSGPCSGASQPHKHLQVMSKFKEDNTGIMTLINNEARQHEGPFKWPVFEFAHLIAPLPVFDRNENYDEIGAKLEGLYLEMIKALGINTKLDSYNFIMNENWMMIVKRAREYTFENISVNSLGFLGRFLLKGEEQKKIIKEKTPFEILESITATK